MYLTGFEILAFLCENENGDVCDDERKTEITLRCTFTLCQRRGRGLELRARGPPRQWYDVMECKVFVSVLLCELTRRCRPCPPPATRLSTRYHSLTPAGPGEPRL